MYAARNRARIAEFALHEIVVVEFFFRQVQAFSLRRFRPACLFVRTALRAGAGIGRDLSPAVGTDFRWHNSDPMQGRVSACLSLINTRKSKTGRKPAPRRGTGRK